MMYGKFKEPGTIFSGEVRKQNESKCTGYGISIIVMTFRG